MTAPGDLVLIFLLIALFVASCAYAAGRLHQRYQLRQDREAAFQDGYETASSRVFSLAARIASPKRPARGAAPVQPSATVTSPAATSPAVASGEGGAPAAAPRADGLEQGLKVAGKADAVAVASSDSPALPGGDAHRLHAAGNEHPAYFGDPGRAVRHQGVTSDTPEPVIPRRRRADQDAAADKPELGVSFGFPAPPPPPRETVAEPAAVGGVNYQPFRDPRPADGSGPFLGRRDKDPPVSGATPTSGAGPHDDGPLAPGAGRRGISVPAQATGRQDSDPGPDDASAPAADHRDTPADPPASSGGKHLVPDELVRAATYRLPPDRVFRAKVPNTTPLPEQTTTHLSLPKPRRRADDNVVPPS